MSLSEGKVSTLAAAGLTGDMLASANTVKIRDLYKKEKEKLIDQRNEAKKFLETLKKGHK